MPAAVGEEGREGRRPALLSGGGEAKGPTHSEGADFNPGTRVLVGGSGPCPHSGAGVTTRSKVTEGKMALQGPEIRFAGPTILVSRRL